MFVNSYILMSFSEFSQLFFSIPMVEATAIAVDTYFSGADASKKGKISPSHSKGGKTVELDFEAPSSSSRPRRTWPPALRKGVFFRQLMKAFQTHSHLFNIL